MKAATKSTPHFLDSTSGKGARYFGVQLERLESLHMECPTSTARCFGTMTLRLDEKLDEPGHCIVTYVRRWILHTIPAGLKA